MDAVYPWNLESFARCFTAMERGLEGIGDPVNTEVFTSGDFGASDPRYGLVLRTFIHGEQNDHKTPLLEQCRRMRFLRKQLLSDFSSGGTIFVHKTLHAPSYTDILALHPALQRHGSVKLFHVRLEEPDYPNGTVREVTPGLLTGYIDRLIAVGSGWGISYESWLTLCRNALAFDRNT